MIELLKNLKNLYKSSDFYELADLGQIEIQKFMKSEICRLIFYDEKNDILFYFDNISKKEVGKNNGIGGYVFKTGEPLCISSCYSDSRFSSLLDINTNMPIIAFPIQNETTKHTLGVIEFTNKKGLQNMIFDNFHMAISINDQQSLIIVSDFLYQLVKNVNEINKSKI